MSYGSLLPTVSFLFEIYSSHHLNKTKAEKYHLISGKAERIVQLCSTALKQ